MERRKSLTQDNITDTTETLDEGNGSEESGVLKSLRVQIKDLKAELKSRPERETLLAEFQAEQGLNAAIETHLVALGHPVGMRDAVKGKLGDADVTLEGVATALTGIGYEVDVENAGSGQEGGSTTTASELAGVSDLSAQVQSAAGSGSPAPVIDQINQATSQADLVKIAAEGGFLTGS
jgi:hypothetical protein